MMTALAPFAKLTDLRSGDVVATTTNIVHWSFESVIDAPPRGSITATTPQPTTRPHGARPRSASSYRVRGDCGPRRRVG